MNKYLSFFMFYLLRLVSALIVTKVISIVSVCLKIVTLQLHTGRNNGNLSSPKECVTNDERFC